MRRACSSAWYCGLIRDMMASSTRLRERRRCCRECADAEVSKVRWILPAEQSKRRAIGHGASRADGLHLADLCGRPASAHVGRVAELARVERLPHGVNPRPTAELAVSRYDCELVLTSLQGLLLRAERDGLGPLRLAVGASLLRQVSVP